VRILLIISSSIAARKCEEIIEYLTKNNIYIDCVLTEKSKQIFNYKKLKKLINVSIYTDSSEKNNKMLHIELSRKANLILVCPATANTIAKYANGYGDNLASTTLLASNKQIIFVPAMNSLMWNNKINKKNIKFLSSIGVEFISPIYGKLFCGETGIGRLANTKKISEIVLQKINQTNNFKGKKCLVTAGPTIEELDSVRYISNYSSGKQGYEIAKQLALEGGNVILISGQTNLDPPPNVKLIKVKTAQQMFEAVKKIKKIDVGIFAAAVSDFKPIKKYNFKIKKNNFKKLEFKKNIDILKYIGNQKKIRPKALIGFAAETKNVNHAKIKLIEKKCDLIVYNQINNNNKVFNSDYNKISIIAHNKIVSFPKMSKIKCAKKIINMIHNIDI